MTTTTTPEQPANSYRIALNLDFPETRMDNVLLSALRGQTENEKLKVISRAALKELFNKKQIIIVDLITY